MSETPFLGEYALRIEAFMRSWLDRIPSLARPQYPIALKEAVEYSLFAGGKRLRPALVLMTARLLGKEADDFLPLAAALEFIHTYSLIHDDLPAMDNDDLRRGMPTCHIRFGEATAILAGDALLTEAFCLAAQVPGEAAAGVVRYLSRAAGLEGMVAGQAADLAAEQERPDADGLDFIHRNKTGALLTASVVLPALAAGAPPAEQDALTAYGEALGMVFQIIDDILDETGSTDTLGKPVGSDREQGKTTYVTIHGVDGANDLARDWGRKALSAIAVFGESAEPFRVLVSRLLERDR